MNWYVVHTKARQESRAKENLQYQGFEVFLPMITLEKVRQGKITQISEPLFSRYLFVQFDTANGHWNRIHYTLGVSKLLALGGRPLVAPASFVEHLKSEITELESETGKAPLLNRLLKANDEVLFHDGPLKGNRDPFRGRR